MDRSTVAITGFGVFSCFGAGPDVLREQVFAGRAGFTEMHRFDTAAQRAHRAAVAPGWPALGDVLQQVADDALQLAQLPDRPAIVLGTQGDWRGLTAFWRGATDRAALSAIAGSLARTLAAELDGRCAGAAGRYRVFNNGCIASATAISHAAGLIATGREQQVLAGGGYLVDEEFYCKFDAGRALSRDAVMRPFSADRSGLLLGDGVALLLLESVESAHRRGVAPLALLAGSALSADSHHVCRPRPDGAGLATAMARAIERAGLRPADIGYVNAHGTATASNDPAETRALRTVFGAELPPVSSTKSCTGHALEGSGALEAVISLLALTDGRLPPTAGFTAADPDCALDCIPNQPRRQDVHAVLSSSVAFGGANAALVLAGVR